VVVEVKAAVFMGQEDVQVLNVPKPSIGADELLIRVAYCGICGSDISAYKTGNYVVGLTIGHEFSGTIEKAGSKVEDLRIGDRVTGNAVIPCGKCSFCLSGKPSLCESMEMPGVTSNGAFAEYVKFPASVVYKLPEELSLLDAALVDPLACILHPINLSSFKPLDSVLIQGAGPLGVLTLETLKKSGAGKIMVAEISDGRKKLAQDLGADIVIDPTEENLPVLIERQTNGLGVDVLFDTAGVPETLSQNFTLVRKGGEIMVVGITEESAPSDFFTVVLNELTIKGVYCGFNEFPSAIEMLSKGLISAGKIVTSVIELEEIDKKGFKPLMKPIDECKVVVRVGER
jgi:(R,R)-butanediol dehydrogenase/meso-butanediol dehydrogenase/diacetyl reductase